MAKTEGIEVTVNVRFDDIQEIIEEIKALPKYTYGLRVPEVTGKTLVDSDAIIEIFRKHLKTEAE